MFLIVLSLDAVERGKAVDAYVLVVAAAVLGGLVLETARGRRTAASPFDAALRLEAEVTGRPRDLQRLEREVPLAEQSAFYLHFRLRPLLREIARERLDLDTEAARTALGDDLFELIHPDREPPRRRDAPGIELRRLDEFVARLERI